MTDTTQREATARCPHMDGCAMYDLFTYSGTLAVWKINYCTGDYTRCARYDTRRQDKPVPQNLMPNGKLLKKNASS